MVDDEKEFRQRINYLILHAIAGKLITTLKPTEPLILGPDFTYDSNKMFDEMEGIRKSLIRELNLLSLKDLQDNFSDQGEPTTDERRAWATAHRTEIRAKYSNVSEWYLLPFEADVSLADFDYWSKAAYFTLDEALWLSVGLQPTARFDVQTLPRTDQRRSEDAVSKFIINRRELFVRELQAGSQTRTQTAATLFEWINRVDLEVHPGFQRMLEKILKQSSKVFVLNETISPSPADDKGKFEAREKVSLSKLLLAMAITEYGYDPEARRSPIPKEMQDIAAKLGLEVSIDTIRQYLQLGATHLPKGWKPIS